MASWLLGAAVASPGSLDGASLVRQNARKFEASQIGEPFTGFLGLQAVGKKPAEHGDTVTSRFTCELRGREGLERPRALSR